MWIWEVFGVWDILRGVIELIGKNFFLGIRLTLEKIYLICLIFTVVCFIHYIVGFFIFSDDFIFGFLNLADLILLK